MGYSPWGHKQSDTTEHLSIKKYIIKFQEEEAEIALVLLKIYLKLEYFFQNLRLLAYCLCFKIYAIFPFIFILSILYSYIHCFYSPSSICYFEVFI